MRKNMGAPTQNCILRIDDKKTIELIEEYKKEECLWNSSLDDYPNKSKRVKAADKIARILNIKNFEGKHVLIKFKNLRNSYSQELKKMRHSLEKYGEGSPKLYRPKVQWFPLMDSFIRPHLQTSRLLSNHQEQTESELTANVKVECYEVGEQEDWAIQQITSEPGVSYSNSECPSDNDELSNHSRAKRRRQSNSCSPSDNFSQNQIFLTDDVSSGTPLPLRTRSEDTFDNFGKYIASLLRSLPSQKALKLQPKIVDMIVGVGIDGPGENSETD